MRGRFQPRRAVVRWTLIAGLLGLGAPVVYSRAGCGAFWHEFWAIDACLDRGGCWDYANERCEFEDQSKCPSPAPR